MYIGFMEAKKNINKQATKILHDIASAYERGDLDDPNASIMYCSFLACICEGKVSGIIDEESCEVKWSLTPEYAKEVEQLQKAIIEKASLAENVIKGPWG